MRRLISPLLISLFALVSAAQAQVALPELAAGPTRFFNAQFLGVAAPGFIPDNPAAMRWARESLFGLSALNGSIQSNAQGSSVNFDGSSIGLTWVTDALVLGAETLSYEFAFDTVDNEGKVNTVGLSMAPVPWLAIGVGYETAELSANDQSLGKFKNDTESTVYGVSLRLGESFYIGLGLTQDDFEQGTPPQEGERSGTMVGIGLLAGRDVIWHLEFSVIDKEDFVSIAGVAFPAGFQRSLALVEVSFNDLVFGVGSYRVDFPSAMKETTGYTFDAGLMQKGGLTLIARREANETELVTGTDSDAVTSLVVGFRFGGSAPATRRGSPRSRGRPRRGLRGAQR